MFCSKKKIISKECSYKNKKVIAGIKNEDDGLETIILSLLLYIFLIFKKNVQNFLNVKF